jgi:hypothetical protein
MLNNNGIPCTSKTEEAAEMVFYIFLGIAAAFTIVLLIYDRARVANVKDVTIPFRETLPDGRSRGRACHLDEKHALEERQLRKIRFRFLFTGWSIGNCHWQ